MRIATAQIALGSTQSQKIKYEKQENLTMWSGAAEQNNQIVEDRLSLLNELSSPNLGPINKSDKLQEGYQISEEDKLKISLIETFIENISGKKIKLQIPKLAIESKGSPGVTATLQQNTPRQEFRLGWGVIYDLHESYYEKEAMSFQANGLVRSQDGREIKIEVSLNMTREFMMQNDINIRAGDAAKVDPLILNISSNIPALTTSKFSFDLDADGESELIPFVGSGSGFLALDRNDDGIINDGRELFGPTSGDGFSDLAQFDEDRNQWIDENDPIFHKLRIWTSAADGQKHLLALGAVGVGAIYLGCTQSPFGLKTTDNQELGQIQKTGIFLFESGAASTIQHIDLTV